MPNTITEYLGNGTQTDFAVPFQYISRDHVKVTKAGASVPFTWFTASVIRITPAPSVGERVKVVRDTPKAPLVNFNASSALVDADLDLATVQAIFIAEEAVDLADAEGTRETVAAAVLAVDQALAEAYNASALAQTAVTAANNAAAQATLAAATAQTFNPANYIPKGGIVSSDIPNGTVTPPKLALGTWTLVASAAAIDLGAQPSLNLIITGTTTINSFGTTATTHGAVYRLRFAGVLTLTHSASLILPTGANITTAAGDTAEVVWEGFGVWRVVDYQRADGTALVPLASTVAPRPTASAGQGQFQSVNVTSSAYTLPAGGSWAYSVIGFNGSGVAVASAGGVAAGGTTVINNAAISDNRGFAWRIT